MSQKSDLQEEALQLEVDIHHPAEGDNPPKELTVNELREAIGTKKRQLQAEHEADQAAKTDARSSAARAKAAAAEQAAAAAEGAAAKKKAHLAEVDEATRAATVVDAKPELLEALGLPAVTDKDRALAEKHGYPVAIPGALVYRVRHSFNCKFGGGLRPENSVVLLRPEDAEAKQAHIYEL